MFVLRNRLRGWWAGVRTVASTPSGAPYDCVAWSPDAVATCLTSSDPGFRRRCNDALVNLSDYFLELALSYDRNAGLRTSAQGMLSNADELLAEHLPAGMNIQGSGGKGQPTLTPWVGFFNPDETMTPERGMYVAYLVSELEANGAHSGRSPTAGAHMPAWRRTGPPSGARYRRSSISRPRSWLRPRWMSRR